VTRVLIVGGGILGPMHAWEAVRRGHEVHHLERERQARGATVRNFGLVWVSGRSASELPAALRARELWERIGTDVPAVGFRANGSLTVVRTAAEWAVAEAALREADAADRELELLDAAGVRARNPALRGELLGALWCGRDATVESRVALPPLRAHLAATRRYAFRSGVTTPATSRSCAPARRSTAWSAGSRGRYRCGRFDSRWPRPRRCRSRCRPRSPTRTASATTPPTPDPRWTGCGSCNRRPTSPSHTGCSCWPCNASTAGSPSVTPTRMPNHSASRSTRPLRSPHRGGRSAARPPAAADRATVVGGLRRVDDGRAGAPGRPRSTAVGGHRARWARDGALPGVGRADRRSARTLGREPTMALIELACLDMAGTTVRDDGAVERAFTVAAGAVGIVPGSRAFAAAMAIVHETMGQAKIEVLRRILGEEETAQRANRAFESAYADLLSGGVVTALPGAVETLTALRECGIKVCLTTGFAPTTRDALLASLGWKPLVDLALSPADAGRGRPAGRAAASSSRAPDRRADHDIREVPPQRRQLRTSRGRPARPAVGELAEHTGRGKRPAEVDDQPLAVGRPRKAGDDGVGRAGIVLGEDRGERVVAEAEQLGLGDRGGGHRARTGVEQAELAEHLTGTEDREKVLAAVDAGAAELDLALADDVEPVTLVALVEQDVAALEVRGGHGVDQGGRSLVVQGCEQGRSSHDV